MWPHERHSKILELLNEEKRISTQRLAGVLDVSRETVRRDLAELEQEGVLRRVHGGAVAPERTVEPERVFAERLQAHAEEKRAIGEVACEIIPRGATLFIDAGTTTLAFATQITRRGDVNIITNSLDIARLAERGPGCDILLLGGRPHITVPATYGETTVLEIGRYLVDYAVISPVGLHPARGVTYYEMHEADVARSMIRQARKVMLLCQSGKVGVESRVSVGRLDDIDHLVTDGGSELQIALTNGRIHSSRR